MRGRVEAGLDLTQYGPSRQGGHRGGSFEDSGRGAACLVQRQQQRTAVTSQELTGGWCRGSDSAFARKKRPAALGAPPPSPAKAGGTLPAMCTDITPRSASCSRPQGQKLPGCHWVLSLRWSRQAILPLPAGGSPPPRAPARTPARRVPSQPTTCSNKARLFHQWTHARVTRGHGQCHAMGRPD